MPASPAWFPWFARSARKRDCKRSNSSRFFFGVLLQLCRPVTLGNSVTFGLKGFLLRSVGQTPACGGPNRWVRDYGGCCHQPLLHPRPIAGRLHIRGELDRQFRAEVRHKLLRFSKRDARLD